VGVTGPHLGIWGEWFGKHGAWWCAVGRGVCGVCVVWGGGGRERERAHNTGAGTLRQGGGVGGGTPLHCTTSVALAHHPPTQPPPWHTTPTSNMESVVRAGNGACTGASAGATAPPGPAASWNTLVSKRESPMDCSVCNTHGRGRMTLRRRPQARVGHRPGSWPRPGARGPLHAPASPAGPSLRLQLVARWVQGSTLPWLGWWIELGHQAWGPRGG
jgi:hypothetical protein